MRVEPLPAPARWVEASPFRAHLRHLGEATGVPWPAIAVHAGVPIPAVRALLFGRNGRPVARLEPRVAAKLLAVGPDSLSLLRRRVVPAVDTQGRARSLVAAGISPPKLARWCRIRVADILAVIDGDVGGCPQLTEVMVLAATRVLAAQRCAPVGLATGTRPDHVAA